MLLELFVASRWPTWTPRGPPESGLRVTWAPPEALQRVPKHPRGTPEDRRGPPRSSRGCAEATPSRTCWAIRRLQTAQRAILKPTKNHWFPLLSQIRGRFSATLLGALGPTIAPEDCLGHSRGPLRTCWEPPRTAQERQGTHRGNPDSPMASPRRLSMQPRSRFGAQVISQGPAQLPP